MGVSGNASVYYNGDHVSLSQTRLRYAPPNGKSVEALSVLFKRLTLTLKALTTSRARLVFSAAFYDLSNAGSWAFLLNSSRAVYMSTRLVTSPPLSRQRLLRVDA